MDPGDREFEQRQYHARRSIGQTAGNQPSVLRHACVHLRRSRADSGDVLAQ
ncbi:MAG: hypothetical protein R2856_23445 [Caldilineaceae bacterium]